VKIRKYAIKIFCYVDYDWMCCERTVDYSELRRIIDVIENALELNIQVEYRVHPYYEEVPDDA